MLGIVGHHLSVGTGIRASEAACIARSLGVKYMEISTIPCNVARRYAHETGAEYGHNNNANRPQIDPAAETPEWIGIRNAVQEEGVLIGAVGGYNNFAVHPDDLHYEKERILRTCRLARTLGSDIVRVFGGDLEKGITKAQAIGQISAAFKELVGYAEQTGVYLAVENHTRLVNDADTMLEIIDFVGSDRLKITLDYTNFYWLNGDKKRTEEMIKKVAPLTVHTHFKNARMENGKCVFTTLGEGDLDIPFVLDELRSAGYNRPFYIACESEDFSDVESVRLGFARSIEYFSKIM